MWAGRAVGRPAGQTNGRMDKLMDGWSETNIPPTTSLCGVIIMTVDDLAMHHQPCYWQCENIGCSSSASSIITVLTIYRKYKSIVYVSSDKFSELYVLKDDFIHAVGTKCWSVSHVCIQWRDRVISVLWHSWIVGEKLWFHYNQIQCHSRHLIQWHVASDILANIGSGNGLCVAHSVPSHLN